MANTGVVDVNKLQTNVRWALDNGLGPRDLVPMLERLQRHAPAGSEASIFAKMELAELLMEKSPWRAAALARSVLAHSEEHRAWGLLGLAHSLLGNFRCAKSAYSRALALAPSCVAYAHNLGHLIDVAFDRPAAALSMLQVAYRSEPHDPEIAASYAHALARAGRAEQARGLLSTALGDGARADELLARWLETDGEPSEP